MGLRGIFTKIIEFILGSKLSIELDEYKNNSSFIIDTLADSLKNGSEDHNNIISKLTELKDKNNGLLDKLFANWQNKQRQLLYVLMSLSVVNILLIYFHLNSFSQLTSIIMGIFA